jgi:ABC-type bacteriocin/lantibiotic exporter with double-glycine peptidase domain
VSRSTSLALCVRALALAVSIGGALGCASYRGTAVNAAQAPPANERGWIWVSGVPEVLQRGERDCGPAAMSAVLSYWGRKVTPNQIRASLGRGADERVRAEELTSFARSIGFDAYAFNGGVPDVAAELRQGRPVIVGVAKRYGQSALAHYEVVVGLHTDSQQVMTLDPANGWRKNTLSGFMSEWNPTGRVVIVVFPAS